MEDYILMSAMYPTMTSGKVDKFLVNPGDKVIKGMPVCEIISEGYFTLLSEVNGRVKDFYVSEGRICGGRCLFDVNHLSRYR